MDKTAPPQEFSIDYTASPTMEKFHNSTAFVRGVRGPIGSGKSVGMCIEIFRRICGQERDNTGKRKSRWAVVRNTYPELETTTIKTWLDWFPEEIFGKVSRRIPICHYIEFDDVQAEVVFIAMDRPEDMKKLLSLELTGIFYNEAREVPLKIVQTGCDRVGRYPSQRSRPEWIEKSHWPTWYGVIMDTNSPDEDHWWPMMAGEGELPEDYSQPDGWEFFNQPPAAFELKDHQGRSKWTLNLDAENLANLPDDYYRNLIAGKPASHVRVYVGNKYGSLLEGKVVYPEFSMDLHIEAEKYKPIPGRPIFVGLDFGQTPAATFSQIDMHGAWHDIHELTTKGVGSKQFGRLLLAEIANVFPGFSLNETFEFWGDPSGDFAQSGSDDTYFQTLKSMGIKVRPAPTQNPNTRIEAGREPLEIVLPGGKMGYQVSKSCKALIKGFVSGYFYPKYNSSGSVLHHDKPHKGFYSHVHEARQYALCGAGYARRLLSKEQNASRGRPIQAKTDFAIY